jgi:hypothetical protein
VNHQNVTVTLPVELLKKARHLAVDEGVSLSRFLAMLVAERVEGADRYAAARERQMEMLEQGLDLKTHGAPRWSRDELHER